MPSSLVYIPPEAPRREAVIVQMQVGLRLNTGAPGQVLFAVERLAPTPADLREMEHECAAFAQADGRDLDCRVVTRGARLYDSRFAIVPDSIDN